LTREKIVADPVSLNLGVVGNCVISALIDTQARVVWSCLPRLDGDPIFYALVDSAEAVTGMRTGRGSWEIRLAGMVRSEQSYRSNTAILATRLFAGDGSAIEITDFCPRFKTRGRMFRPQMLVRRVRALAGTPRISVHLRPSFEYGARAPEITHGSNHVRYVTDQQTLRLTTNAPVSYLLEETPFLLEGPTSFVLGPDETLRASVEHTAREFEEETESYWRLWTRSLALPLEWQDAVIRAAITLKLCTFEETGAIVAAMTTSIPEAPGTQRNWDYRYCWLRDAFFVVRALNSLSEVETMENYLRYLANVVSASPDGHLQPVYGIALEQRLVEREVNTLSGYRGMGPVRVGNQAYEHLQHDVYGNVVLAAAQSFFDERLLRPATPQDFERLERVGEQAYKVYALPDASMWELRTRERVHTSSSLMCWAACDRLSRIAERLGRQDRAELWRQRAAEIRAAIEEKAWNAERGSFAESFGGQEVEAGLLLMAEVGFLPATDPRFVGTIAEIERRLRRGPNLFRYAVADDFGVPETAFNICTFWYLDALARLGRVDEARELFEHMLSCRNHLGLLSEDVHPETGELWGNYPQTYSLVGIINAATRLSRGWEEVV
jgi:pentatricopeptide repeat protein